MSIVKSLAYIAAGVGAVVLAPVTGGSSLALAIGAMGTTTAAGAALGIGIGATAAAASLKLDEEKKFRISEMDKRKSIQTEMTDLEDLLNFDFKLD